MDSGWLRCSVSGDRPKGPVDCVITSYSIHYTKLYEQFVRGEADGPIPFRQQMSDFKENLLGRSEP